MSGNIRLASEADLPVIDKIYNQAIAQRFCTADLTPIGMTRRREWFAAHPAQEYPIYLYESDNIIRGWLSLSPYRPGREALKQVAEVSFYVAEDARGKRIGSHLLEHAIQACPALEKRILFAIVIEGNSASLALLKKHGFEQWGYLPQVIACYGETRGQFYLGRILSGIN